MFAKASDSDMEQEDAWDTSSSSEEAATVGQTKSIPPHPNDIMHRHWYETLVRLRATLTVMFDMVLMLALNTGLAMTMFFSVLLVPEWSAKVFLGIILVPPLLLMTAVFFDEMLDLALDAMDLPAFGLFRATITVSVGKFCPAWSTRKTELGLVILFDVVPILAAVLCCLIGGTQKWYYLIFQAWVIASMAAGFLIAFVYTLCHTHVAHHPLLEAKLSVLWHNMGNLGDFHNVELDVEETPLAQDSKPRLRKMLSFLFAAFCCESFVLLVFVVWKNFVFLFIGQLVTTTFLAFALTAYAPRLLGKAFWFTLAFFVILTGGLTIGTTATMNVDPHFVPPALGPGTPGYGAPLPGNDLPLHFFPKEPGYPICQVTWGRFTLPQEEQLNVIDLALLAKATYALENQTEFAIGEMFNGTVLSEFQVCESAPDKQIGRWIVVDFPRVQVRVIAIRGTDIMLECFADLQMYSSIAVLTFMGHLFPVLKIFPPKVMQQLISNRLGVQIFGTLDTSFISQITEIAEFRAKEAHEKQFSVVITGHSLGGAIAGALAAKLRVMGLGVSAPGLRYQAQRWELTTDDFRRVYTNIVPENDVVPKVDDQVGMIAGIRCTTPPIECHGLSKSVCELWTKCGDPRNRDFRRVCSNWYTPKQTNM